VPHGCAQGALACQVTDNLVQEFIRIRPQHEDQREAIVLALCKRTYTSRCLVSFACCGMPGKPGGSMCACAAGGVGRSHDAPGLAWTP
jgi:hypothetical protein